MDVVEVSPPYDHADITSLAASSLIMEYLCLKAWQKGARAAPVAARAIGQHRRGRADPALLSAGPDRDRCRGRP